MVGLSIANMNPDMAIIIIKRYKKHLILIGTDLTFLKVSRFKVNAFFFQIVIHI